MELDGLGRLPISDALRKDMTAALNGIPPTKRGALLIVADSETKIARTQVAAKLGENWKIAAGVGFDLAGHQKPVSYVEVIGFW